MSEKYHERYNNDAYTAIRERVAYDLNYHEPAVVSHMNEIIDAAMSTVKYNIIPQSLSLETDRLTSPTISMIYKYLRNFLGVPDTVMQDIEVAQDIATIENDIIDHMRRYRPYREWSIERVWDAWVVFLGGDDGRVQIHLETRLSRPDIMADIRVGDHSRLDPGNARKLAADLEVAAWVVAQWNERQRYPNPIVDEDVDGPELPLMAEQVSPRYRQIMTVPTREAYEVWESHRPKALTAIKVYKVSAGVGLPEAIHQIKQLQAWEGRAHEAQP